MELLMQWGHLCTKCMWIYSEIYAPSGELKPLKFNMFYNYQRGKNVFTKKVGVQNLSSRTIRLNLTAFIAISVPPHLNHIICVYLKFHFIS
jgi:hypothetical protein